MKASEARALIGKTVEWDYRGPSRRSLCGPHHGIVEEVSGKNICISGDWRWLPDIIISATMGSSATGEV